jgi:hypothetical protein
MSFPKEERDQDPGRDVRCGALRDSVENANRKAREGKARKFERECENLAGLS